MKRTLAIALFAAAPVFAQTPADLDDYYAKKAAADAANQVVVRANANNIAQINGLLTAMSDRIAALETSQQQILATLKTLPPGATTKQVVDAIIAKLQAP